MRLRTLGRASLWFDEIVTAENVVRGPRFIILQSLRDTGPLPLAYLFPWLASLCGRTEFMLRLPDALFGILTVPLAAATAWRLARSRTAALAAAAILSVSQHHIYYSREARGYALLAFLALLSFRLLLEALETARIRWWAGFALCSVAAFFTSYFYCFTHAALGAWGIGWIAFAADRGEWSRAHSTKQLGRFGVAWLAPIAAFIPWAVLAAAAFQGYALHEVDPDARRHVGEWLGRIATVWLPAAWGWRMVAAILIVAGDLIMIPHRRGLLMLTAALPIGLASACYSISTSGHFLSPRYAIAALPLCAVAIGLGLAGFVELAGRARMSNQPPPWRRAIRAVAATAAAALLALNCLAQWKVYSLFESLEKQDWRTAVRWIRRDFQPGDLIVPGLPGAELCLHHYLPPDMGPFVTSAEWGEPGNVLEAIGRSTALGLAFWYVVPTTYLDSSPELSKLLSLNLVRIAVIPGEQPITLYFKPRPKPAGR